MLYGCLSAIVLCCASAPPLRGQGVIRATGSVAGEISLEGSERADWLSVELVSSGRTVSRGSVTSDGRFELVGVPSGEYELRLTGTNETIVQRQFVSVHGHLDGVVFRLERPERARPVSGTVTVHSLLHKVPAAARAGTRSGLYGGAQRSGRRVYAGGGVRGGGLRVSGGGEVGSGGSSSDGQSGVRVDCIAEVYGEVGGAGVGRSADTAR
jgi:hypothetical protein